MLINEFYANREVFITGGTGFLGKALIEKLLRDSPKIKVVYVLLRGKKSLSVEQRLEKFKKDKAFECIHEQCPEVLNKLHPIQGDCQELGLGIQPDDLKLMQNVSIIFHNAANVKFDDPVRSSILLNTRGTYELVKIAETLKNLVVFMHCSTAYCNPFEKIIEEKIYKMPVDWRKAIKIAETYDVDTINALFYKYTGFYPNSYTFTKNLSEQIIQEYSSKLPMIVFRPSVVINSWKEPKPGWTDNLNGPISGLAAIGIGIVPVFLCKADLAMDFIPIDVVTRQTIVGAYKRGFQFLRKEPVRNGVEVINCCSGDIYKVNLNVGLVILEGEIRRNPMENKIWHYDPPYATSCTYNFYFQFFLMAIPVSFVLDMMLRFKNRKPMMMTMNRRIIYAIKALSFFSSQYFFMVNKNMMALEDSIPQTEIETFGFKSYFNLDVLKYFVQYLSGLKYYIFNQPMQSTAKARKNAKILLVLSRSIKCFIFSLFIFYLWSFAV